MSSVSGVTSGLLQPLAGGSNWLQSVASATSSNASDWMSPSSAGPDMVVAAANAFAAAHQLSSSNLSSLAVNQGIFALEQQQLTQSVNIIA